MGPSFTIGLALLAAAHPVAPTLHAQTSATLLGRALDASGSVILRAMKASF
jgi:hypothetical protein